MYRFNQHSFVGGQLDRGLMGRQDLERYFQGASKLENFIVRKQGNVTKRRGTEMIADLSDLFGTGESIAYSRILPFSYDITSGYYLLLAESTASETGCFILSDNGVQIKKTITRRKLDEANAPIPDTETSEETLFFDRSVSYSNETTAEEKESDTGEKERWEITTEISPFRMDIPYEGKEFESIGFNQSGDTLFLVHANHAPAKVTNKHERFLFAAIDFSHAHWKRPRITSINYSNFNGNGALRNISYVATYVKDGIESLPSEPFVASYKLPWNSEAIITISVDKGMNETEPDHYNIYKKEGSDYGLIVTIGDAQKVVITPTLQNTQIIPDHGQYDYYFTSRYKKEDYLNTVATPAYYTEIYGKYGAAASGVNLYCSGGLKTNSSTLSIALGEKSGSAFTKLLFYPDAVDGAIERLSGASPWQGNYYLYFYQTGTQFSAELTFNLVSDNSKKYTVSTETINIPLKTGFNMGFNQKLYYRSYSTQFLEGPYTYDMERGSIEFSFYDLIKEQIGETNMKPGAFEVTEVKIKCADHNIIYWHGLEFFNELNSNSTIQDDYITPNLALTPPREGVSFTVRGDYPSCVALYTQRLAFAASTNQPFTWWMSCVGDLYNFSTHAAIRQDDALEVTVPATEFPNINHMVLSRDLVLFCDNGEWIVRPLSGNTLAYDTVECKKQSAIGCAKSVPPLQVGDEIIFADNSKRVIRSIKYQFSSDGYESNDLSILSQSIFFTNPVVSMCYKQHPESLVLCELADGSVAALVYMKEHNVVAWTRHSLGGGWKCRGIASNKAHADETTHVAMLVGKYDGSTEIWRVRDDDESEDLSAQLCMDGLRFALGSEIGEAAFEGGQIVVDLTTGENIARVYDLDADKEYAVGYPFTSTFVSVRPEPQGAETFQWELKNAKKVNIRTLNGSSFTVKEAGMGDEYASKVEIERNISNGEITTPGLVDATDILLNGENSRDGRIEIKHDGILPLTIESFSVDYETQPLYGSEG